MEAEPETKVLDLESKVTERESEDGERDPSPSDGPRFGAPDREADRVVGRYELIHRLGHGGMATVYLGRATGRAGFEKLVAVKVIHPHLGREAEFVDMFLDEARIAARLTHPHVVQILDVGEDHGVFFMVMEYVEGETLSSVIRQLRKSEEVLTLSAILQVAADTAEGLAAAHELSDRDGKPYKLVHRDVSPHNLLLGMDGNLKVVDFGIMKAAGKRSNTLTGQLRGKLPYMSPEQARGKPIDHRTDLFALGAVLWELCTNKRLFGGATEAETLELVTNCEVPDLLSLRPDLPDGLADVLKRALARDVDDRYDSAQQMLRDIRELRRQLSAEVDPRAELATVMHDHFGARMDYIRAAVRSRDGSGARPVTASSASMSMESAANDATEVVGRQRRDPPSGGHGAVPRGTESGVVAATTTTTTTLVPARQWPLWILLPLIGAGLGTALVGFSDRTRSDDRPVAAVTPTAADRGGNSAEEMPMTAVPAPAQESVSMVKWHINTRPQGAVVKIAGVPQEGRTPLAVELPQGSDSVRIEVALDGYRPFLDKRAPLLTRNLDYTLTAVKAKAAVDLAPATTVLRPRKKPRKSPRSSETTAKKDPATEPAKDPESFPDPVFDALEKPR